MRLFPQQQRQPQTSLFPQMPTAATPKKDPAIPAIQPNYRPMKNAKTDWNTYGPLQAKGMLQQGNIDLNKRPIVKNDDGSHSSEYSVSFTDEYGREVLVPTIVDGKFLTPNGKKPKEGSAAEKAMFKKAWQHYLKTGEHLGIFASPAEADAVAQMIHTR